MFASHLRLLIVAAVTPVMLCQCELLDPVLRPSKVIYAQPPRAGQPSPLDGTLTAVPPPFVFSRDHFTLTPHQVELLKKQAATWGEHPPHVHILGFARRGLPAGYARSLAQRRADAVRQSLIDAGMEADRLHATGYGNDQPGLCASDEVRLYVVP